MILCIDPDGDDRASTSAALEAEGFETTGADTLAAARKRLAATDAIECVITEYDLPDGTGLELIDRTRDEWPDVACVLYTDVALGDIDTEAFGSTIAEYVPKDGPDAERRLVGIVEHSLAFRSQTAYPLPDDEGARLAALERYAADPTTLSESLGRLTRLATDQFDVNSAAVGLIEDHQERFLSCHGASFDSIDREDTVCTYTILGDDVTVVEDTVEDPRFADNEGLRDADIRFYAGAPMITPEGHRIGVFCLHDDDPRSFPDLDRELLALYADEAMEQLQLRHRARDPQEGRAID